MIKTITGITFSVILIFSSTLGLNFENIPRVSEEREFTGKLSCPKPPSLSEMINQKKNLHSNSAETEKIVDQFWYSEVIKNIEQDEYDFSYNEELKSYQSSNPKTISDLLTIMTASLRIESLNGVLILRRKT